MSSYSEAIDLLYSLPIFSFSHQNVETFLAFICAIPQQRRDRIRFLDLRWLGALRSYPYREIEYQTRPQWSYKRIDNIKALSQMPNASVIRAEQGVVNSDWVVREVLKGMKGLEKGGVNWGCASTGCYAQE